MSQPDTKRVSMIELFYDLVFVYMIAQATSLLRHLQHGIVAPSALLLFAFIIIVFINSWMVQSVFTNRFGESSWTDIGFTFVDMMIVLYMSNAFGSGAAGSLRPFFIAAGLLSLTLLLQYLLVALRTDQAVDRKIAQLFLIILAVRTGSLLLAGVLPSRAGIVCALIGVIVSWVAPSFTGFATSKHPIIFAHLLERLTSLTIVLFGEVIVGIAGFFTESSFSITSVLIFVIVATLFFAYITQFDHLIDDHRQGETGNLLIYLHYPIIFGLSMINVAIELVTNTAANHAFAVSFLYVGLTLFNFGIWLAQRYNKPQYQGHARQNWDYMVVTVLGWLVCLQMTQPLLVLLLTAVVTSVGSATLVTYMQNQRMRL